MKLTRLVVASLMAAGVHGATRSAAATVPLTRDWALQSSAKVPDKGEAISRPGYATTGWYAVTVPNTLVGALVENGTYPDPYFGMNLRSLPGMTYPVAKNFSHLPTARRR